MNDVTKFISTLNTLTLPGAIGLCAVCTLVGFIAYLFLKD